MIPFDDKLPEEQEPEFEELITLLRHANLSPMVVDPAQRSRILSRTRARLMKTTSDTFLEGDIFADDIQKLGSFPNESQSRGGTSYRRRRLVQVLHSFAAVLVIAALIASLLMLKSSLLGRPGGIPTLTLSSSSASLGSTITVMLKHFAPLTHVVLTHDIQEPIATNGSRSITIDVLGNAIIPLVIDATWGPGFHVIVAEDVNSRSTASANLQIIGEGPTPIAHLLIDTTPLAMGADYAGTNTIRPFSLANSGGGSISWSASSDAPWLLVKPSQGMFGQQESLSVAVQRLGLKPGDYHSSLTISSNVSPPQHIEVDMSVRALPANAGAVLTVTPALLSFSSSDGQNVNMQQVLSINNAGSQSLHWSLNPVQGLTCNWLSVSPLAGSVDPGTTRTLSVNVQSQCLLPGVYSDTLTFTAAGAIDSTQSVIVSVVVQPHCGLVTSTGFLAFTLVAGHTALANQSFTLNTTPGCTGTLLSWRASSTASWLSIAPGSGQVQVNASSIVIASVNAARLTASKNPYSADLSIVFGQSSLTVVAQVIVQEASPTAPIMSASPLSLNFSNIEGQPDPTGQVVTLTNSGHSSLTWHVTATPLPSFVWLGASPAGGTIAAGQSGQVTIHVSTAQLTPGNYVGQITLNGMDTKGTIAPGSPQTIIVNLVMQPPCTLLPPSSRALSFSAVQNASANPAVQTNLFTAWGSCAWPLTWKTSVSPSVSWLTQAGSSGTIGGADQSDSTGISANTTGLAAGTYSTTVEISAHDFSNVTVQGSIQTFTVTLTVLPPCRLSTPAPTSLALTLTQGQTTSSTLAVALSESGTCARPVTWQASPSSSWLNLNATSGSGSSLGVHVSAANLLPGIYTGTITISATDNSRATIESVQAVTVTLTVKGFSLNGTVLACKVLNCATPLVLAGATVTITNGNRTVATTMTDASGAFSFSNIPSGTYTLTAIGVEGSNTHYNGIYSVTLTGNIYNMTIQALQG